jgi:hypothetical protein
MEDRVEVKLNLDGSGSSGVAMIIATFTLVLFETMKREEHLTHLGFPEYTATRQGTSAREP